MLHVWVEKELGTPRECWDCGTTEDRRYAWANISGEYKQETSDWERLCYPCHAKKDGRGFQKKTHCKRGHELITPNLYFRPNGQRDCLTCRKMYSKIYYMEKVRK